jgi:kynurenine formamidase
VGYVQEAAARLSNWGRWGPNDERGTTNFIGKEQLIRAGRLIRKGAVFDLGIPFDRCGPQPGAARINPMLFMSETGAGQDFTGSGVHYADDYVFMPLQAGTQWDALAHVYYDGRMYNGFASSGVTVKGADHCSIDTQAKGVTGRGVLVDVAGHLGVDWLDAGFAIGPDLLDRILGEQGVQVETGDILLVRTGWRRKFVMEGNPVEWQASAPGLAFDCLDWIAAHEIAAVCSDNYAVEVRPAVDPSETLPFHMVGIRDMGLLLGEIFDLEELAVDCWADSVWDFFFCAPPIKFRGAVGSPINPLAIK